MIVPDVSHAQRRAVLEEIRYYRDAECLHNDGALALLAAYEEDTCPVYSPVTLTVEEIKDLETVSADKNERERMTFLMFYANMIIARSKGE